MKEREVRNISIAAALLSLLAIYLFSLYAPAEKVNVCDIDHGMKDTVVKVSGTAKNVRVNEGNVFFTLADGDCEIKTVVWRSTAEYMEVPIGEGDLLSLKGSVDSYRGELEVIVSGIL